jgi:hypothetical protein
VDSSGNVYVTEAGGKRIRKIANDAPATVSTAAEGGFSEPAGIAVDAAGNLYVADRTSHTIRKVAPAGAAGGTVTNIGGTVDRSGFADGSGSSARFFFPHGVALDSAGNLYVADSSNNSIRRAALPVSLPIIASQPLGGTVTVNDPSRPPTFQLTVVAQGNPAPSFQWTRNGQVVNGATNSTLVVNARGATAGEYRVVVTNSEGSVPSAAAALNVVPASWFSALAIRASMATAQTLVLGSFVSGEAPKNILIRAGGPFLDAFGLVGMADPRIEFFRGNTSIATNDNWGTSGIPPATFVSVGLTPFGENSRDAALTQTIGGTFSAHVTGTGPGVVLVEAYELTGGTSPRMTNLSARNRVGTGADMMFAGLVITGPAGSMKQVLIRAVGPGLAGAPFNVQGVLANPVLEVFSVTGGVATSLRSNDDWNINEIPATLFSDVGAFAIAPGRGDSALLLTLAPGTYTLQVSGVNGGTGEAVVEVYEVL